MNNESKILAGLIANRHLINDCPLKNWDRSFFVGINHIVFSEILQKNDALDDKEALTPMRIQMAVKKSYPKMDAETISNSFADIMKEMPFVKNGDIAPEVKDQVDICIKKDAERISLHLSAYAEDGVSGADIVGYLNDEVQKITDSSVAGVKKEQSKIDAVKELIQHVVDMSEGKIQILHTGMVPIDRLIMITPTDYVIVGARPSVGKSAFGLTLFNEFTRNQKGLFIPLEMPKTEIIERLAQIRYGVPISDIKKKIIENRASQPEFMDFTRALDGIAKNDNMIIASPASNGICNIENLIKKKIREDDIKFVIVDYIQKVKNDTKKQYPSRQLELADLSFRLREIPLTHKIPVITMAQLKRIDGKKPKLEDFRECGDLEQDASIAMLLDRDIMAEEPVSDVICQVAKNRNGSTGTAKICFIKNTAKFGVLKEAYE